MSTSKTAFLGLVVIKCLSSLGRYLLPQGGGGGSGEFGSDTTNPLCSPSENHLIPKKKILRPPPRDQLWLVPRDYKLLIIWLRIYVHHFTGLIQFNLIHHFTGLFRTNFMTSSQLAC